MNNKNKIFFDVEEDSKFFDARDQYNVAQYDDGDENDNIAQL